MVSKRTLPAHAGSTARTPGIVLMSIVLWSLTAGHIFGDSPKNAANAKPAKAALLAVPLSFEANQGQTDSQVKFLSRGDGYSLFLTSNEVVFSLRTLAGVKAPPSVFRMELLGADRKANVSGADILPGAANYYMGNDPKKWRSGIRAYGKVKYRGVYPGIDAVFYGNQRQLEYDFVVAPGADPKRISLGLTGVTPSLDIEGNVLLKLADGELALKKPIVYQSIDGGKKTVDAMYTISGGKVRFQLGKYDHSQTLVIDPVFTYLTYLGGSGPDQIGANQVVDQTSSPAQALAIDSAGDVYVTGFTMSADFPVVNPYQATSKTNQWTAFVSALNPSGTALLYSTYLGGSVYTAGNSVVWDSHDNALYVVGTTNSPDFPITAGAFQTILSPNEVGVQEVSAGQYNAFVAKFSPSGQLTNSTFLGGNYPTTGFGVTTDPQGRAYVVGFTQYNCIPPDSASYSCFPTTPGAVIPAGTVSQNGNGFVSVFDPKLSTLLYSTLLGDPNGAEGSTSEAFGVTVDPSGNIYVAGNMIGATLPTTPGVVQPSYHGGSGAYGDGLIAKIAPTEPGPTVKLATAGQVEPFAPESIVAAYGTGLATGTILAATIPLPVSLDGNTVTVTDSAAAAHQAPLFYVSPSQINFEIPAGTATGAATVAFQNQNGTTQSVPISIGTVSPGIFELNGAGLVAAWVLPVISGVQQPLQPVYQIEGGSVVPLPINLGPSTQQVYLEMYGTGIRSAKSVTVTVGTLGVPVLYAGAAPVYAGLDQVNIGPLPAALAGTGSVNIVITADGQAANTVNVTIQ